MTLSQMNENEVVWKQNQMNLSCQTPTRRRFGVEFLALSLVLLAHACSLFLWSLAMHSMNIMQFCWLSGTFNLVCKRPAHAVSALEASKPSKLEQALVRPSKIE